METPQNAGTSRELRAIGARRKSYRHAAIIAHLARCFPGIEATGFHAEMRQILNSIQMQRMEALLLSVIPDAHLIFSKQREITVFEVEVTSHLTEDKVAAYGQLFHLFRDFHWKLNLMRVSAWGSYNVVDLENVLDDLEAYRALEVEYALQPPH